MLDKLERGERNEIEVHLSAIMDEDESIPEETVRSILVKHKHEIIKEISLIYSSSVTFIFLISIPWMVS